MIQPGVYNIKMQRRADFSIQLRFLDSARNPINLTGWSAISQIWDQARGTKYADFSISYTNRIEGRLSMTLSASVTTTLPEQTVYDVMLINPAGEKEYYLEGGIVVDQGYSSP